MESSPRVSTESLVQLLELLLDTIVMNRNYSQERTAECLEVLQEVRDMDMSPAQ